MRQHYSIYLLMLMGTFLIFANGCKKDDEEGNNKTFTDTRDGQMYKTVKIGNQVWMAENLKYLPDVVGSSTSSDAAPHFYIYGYNGTNLEDAKATANYNTYGVLYNWDAANAACPTGWHLPSEEEWTDLTDFLGGENVAGGKLKESGTTHWDDNEYATNETNFTALPGGGYFGSFDDIGQIGFWWSATDDNNYAWSRIIFTESRGVYTELDRKEYGLSVRCVKN